MNIGMELRQRQQLVITPQLQQALRLLQLSSLEFSQELEQAVSNNPFLEETAPPVTAEAAASADAAGIAPVEENAVAAEEFAAEEPYAGGETLMENAGDMPNEPPTATDGGEESGWVEAAYDGNSDANRGGDENDWTEWSESPQTLHDNLRQQLLQWGMDDRMRMLTHLLIEELTDAGYLETPLEELAGLVDEDDSDDSVTIAELEAALRIVQQLEPPGIGARSLQECLLLQLAELPAGTPAMLLAREIVTEHFDLLAKRQFPRLQQLTGCDETALHSARALIRTLDPRPGRRFAADDTRYIVPDIIVSRVRNGWVAKMNPAVQPNIRLNRRYADLAGGRGNAASCSRMLQEARWLLRNIEQRFETIQKVASAIVAHQKIFFSYGEAAMKPLALKDIAAEVGLHESTVCRVTNGKYMATPRGLFEFKYFFSRQLSTDDGGSCSAMAIRALIKELIAAENPERPLSDVQLAKLLAEQGFKLARRTVTKYRTQMRIPAVELRRVGHQSAA